MSPKPTPRARQARQDELARVCSEVWCDVPGAARELIDLRAAVSDARDHFATLAEWEVSNPKAAAKFARRLTWLLRRPRHIKSNRRPPDWRPIRGGER